MCLPATPRHAMAVMMGQGEPLYNYRNVVAALRVAMDPEGLAISRRRIVRKRNDYTAHAPTHIVHCRGTGD
jgi:adenine C2-methylase RlmN of 23S rRNA A2503 and tRNA A37